MATAATSSIARESLPIRRTPYTCQPRALEQRARIVVGFSHTAARRAGLQLGESHRESRALARSGKGATVLQCEFMHSLRAGKRFRRHERPRFLLAASPDAETSSARCEIRRRDSRERRPRGAQHEGPAQASCQDSVEGTCGAKVDGGRAVRALRAAAEGGKRWARSSFGTRRDVRSRSA